MDGTRRQDGFGFGRLLVRAVDLSVGVRRSNRRQPRQSMSINPTAPVTNSVAPLLPRMANKIAAPRDDPANSRQVLKCLSRGRGSRAELRRIGELSLVGSGCAAWLEVLDGICRMEALRAITALQLT